MDGKCREFHCMFLPFSSFWQPLSLDIFHVGAKGSLSSSIFIILCFQKYQEACGSQSYLEALLHEYCIDNVGILFGSTVLVYFRISIRNNDLFRLSNAFKWYHSNGSRGFVYSKYPYFSYSIFVMCNLILTVCKGIYCMLKYFCGHKKALV